MSDRFYAYAIRCRAIASVARAHGKKVDAADVSEHNDFLLQM